MKRIYLLATVVAIMTGIAVYLFASGLKAENEIVPVVYDMQFVVAAAQDIPVNIKLTKEMLVLVEIPRAAVAAGTVLDIEELVGKTTKYPLLKGEILFSSKAAEIGDLENNHLSDRIRNGYRAFTVYTDEVAGVAGYLRVGDRIDIMVTIVVPVETTVETTAETSAETSSETKVVNNECTYYFLQNVPIIAIGSSSQYVTGIKELQTYSNITLEVLAEDCTMLEYNIINGKVKIVLRGFGDEVIVDASYYPIEKAGIWIN